MNGLPNEDDLLRVDPVRLQSALAAMPDEMVAAALQGLPAAVGERLRAELSPRRRGEMDEDRRTYPGRTREVARRLLLRIVFDLEPAGDEDPVAEESVHSKFMKKLAMRHPDFVWARKERVERAWMEHLKKTMRGE